MRYLMYLFLGLELSCITKNASSPQEVKKNLARANETKCLASIMEGTSGSMDSITQNAIIYLAPSGENDILFTPYTTYKIETSSDTTKYCFRLPTDHSIWSVDKTSAGERLINDDTCTSFLQLKQIKGSTRRQDKLLKEEIKNRLAQLKAFKKRDLQDKTKEEKQDIETQYQSTTSECQEFLKANNLK